MKLLKIKTLLIALFSVVILFAQSGEAHAKMDARMKALGSMALYGTAGGALLGAASMAFGTSGRAIAQGASLGLYAGLIFGTYVVVSHSMKKNRYQSPEPAPRPNNYYPEDSNSPYSSGGSGSQDNNSWGYYNRIQDMNESSLDFGLDMKSLKKLDKKSRSERPAFYMNLVNFQF